MAQTERPSRAALRRWLKAVKGRTQEDLAKACGVRQQTISSFLRERTPVAPSQRIADLIEVATGGEVRAAGWLTADERRKARATRKRAEKFSGTEARA